jgi:hypothetical protein
VDTGAVKMWMARLYPTYAANTCLISNGLSTMGFALPGALAVALAKPESKVLAVVGDGAWLMHSQEIETAVREGIPLTVLIWEDNGYGLIEWKMQMELGEHSQTAFTNPDVVQYAESFGAKGYQVGSADELLPTLRAALADDGVSIVKERGLGYKLAVDTDRHSIREVLNELLDRYSVADISVLDPPLEEVIGNIFSAPKGMMAEGRTAREAATESSEYLKTYVWYPSRMGRPDLLIPHAQSAGRASDLRVRQHIAQVQSLVLIDQWTKERARAAREAGHAPGPEGSIAKLVLSEISRAAAAAHSEIAGPSGLMTNGDGAALEGTSAEIMLSFPAQSIAGGTDEVQRNAIAERVLGLPREARPDKEVPFNETKR